MGNSLGEELTDKYVVLKADSMAPAYADIKFRIAKVTGGFGAHDFTSGRALFVETPFDGEKFRADGYDVERFATDEEVQLVTTKEVKTDD